MGKKIIRRRILRRSKRGRRIHKGLSLSIVLNNLDFYIYFLLQSLFSFMKLPYSFHNHKLILNRPVISLDVLKNDIRNQHDPKRQLLRIYKDFYKLRNLVSYPSTYQALLRRTFKYSDFNEKRRIFLSLPPITHDELLSRMVNTLVFVFNSTVSRPDHTALTFDDIQRERTEFGVVKTILYMDKQNPMKYDFKYNWLDDLEQDIKKSEAIERGKHSLKLDRIGYKQYIETLMRLNETLGMCF